MEAAARKRKERLAALRGKPESQEEEQNEEGKEILTVTVEERAAQVLKSAKDVAVAAPIATDYKPALTELMPRGETKDLKQHIKPRLDELEERTQEVILELARERLSQQGNN